MKLADLAWYQTYSGGDQYVRIDHPGIFLFKHRDGSYTVMPDGRFDLRIWRHVDALIAQCVLLELLAKVNKDAA